MKNVHGHTVKSFGDEWNRFDQTDADDAESKVIFEKYFRIFPWEKLNENSVGFDMGCGSGRWARFVAKRVGHLNCIEPSNAIEVAVRNLSRFDNVTFIRGSDAENTIEKNSQDFGYSLGVLHHVPDTQLAIQSCTNLLKLGAPLLLYLYYSFDNRSKSYFRLWQISNIFRQIISSMPRYAKNIITDLIAIFVYWPLARITLLIERLDLDVANFPLSFYRKSSFYVMRTDSRDRFGTPLEKRFAKTEIMLMMQNAGLGDIIFSEYEPFWCAVGYRVK